VQNLLKEISKDMEKGEKLKKQFEIITIE